MIRLTQKTQSPNHPKLTILGAALGFVGFLHQGAHAQNFPVVHIRSGVQASVAQSNALMLRTDLVPAVFVFASEPSWQMTGPSQSRTPKLHVHWQFDNISEILTQATDWERRHQSGAQAPHLPATENGTTRDTVQLACEFQLQGTAALGQTRSRLRVTSLRRNFSLPGLQSSVQSTVQNQAQNQARDLPAFLEVGLESLPARIRNPQAIIELTITRASCRFIRLSERIFHHENPPQTHST